MGIHVISNEIYHGLVYDEQEEHTLSAKVGITESYLARKGGRKHLPPGKSEHNAHPGLVEVRQARHQSIFSTLASETVNMEILVLA